MGNMYKAYEHITNNVLGLLKINVIDTTLTIQIYTTHCSLQCNVIILYTII